MTRLAKWLIRIYPGRWRRRYGTELEALIEDCGSGWRDALDVAKGALLLHSVRWPVVVGGCALLGALAGLGISFLLPQMYVSTVAIAVINGPDDAVPLPSLQRALSRGSLTDVINAQTLYPRDMFKRPMEDIVDTMRRHIRVTRLRENSHFELSFGYEDRLKARAATAMLVSKIMTAHLNSRDGSTLEVKKPASLPQRSVNPYVVKGTIWGLAAGLLLGSIIVRVRRQQAVA
jgi:hypothetical protein